MNNPWHHLLDTVNLCRIFTVLLLCHLNVKEIFQHNEHARQIIVTQTTTKAKNHKLRYEHCKIVVYSRL